VIYLEQTPKPAIRNIMYETTMEQLEMQDSDE